MKHNKILHKSALDILNKLNDISDPLGELTDLQFAKSAQLKVKKIDDLKFVMYSTRPFFIFLKSSNFISDFQYTFHVKEINSQTLLEGKISVKVFSGIIFIFVGLIVITEYLLGRSISDTMFLCFYFITIPSYLLFQYFLFKKRIDYALDNFFE